MIEIDLLLMIFVFVIFIFLLITLNKILFKPMVAFIDNRKSDIKESLQNASTNNSEVESLKKEAEDIIDQAKKEAGKIREEAIDLAKRDFALKADEKRSSMEGEFATFKSELVGEKSNLRDSLMSQMPLFRESLKLKLSKI